LTLITLGVRHDSSGAPSALLPFDGSVPGLVMKPSGRGDRIADRATTGLEGERG